MYSRIRREGAAKMDKADFINRLVELRTCEGVSARDMSLSMGQGESYINNIENGSSFPSLTGFFYICEYFRISPKEFFDVEVSAPTKIRELADAAKHLDGEQLDHLIAFIKTIK